ncbi:GNAT family N-acetyltransferase [Micromonospora sp. CPCC 206060]|uniref:GNAT family N-acetyltransferase n=1 Tax=Micromonospora sp. CPCC 206060 TaxID=3122406 RepID=UPI002FF36517
MTYAIRTATERDLDDLAAFEVTIAEISFGDEAVVDPAVHRKKLAKALDRDADGMIVAVDDADRPVGWLWLAVNTNFLTGDRYINFRSLAVRPDADRERVGEVLMDHALDYAHRAGVTEIVGKVHMANQQMRVLYRRFGFEPAHLTLRRRIGADSRNGADG